MPKRGVTIRRAASTVASGMRPCAAGGEPNPDLGVRLDERAHQAVAQGHRVREGGEHVDEVAGRAERRGDGLDLEDEFVSAAEVLDERQGLEVVDVDEAAGIVVELEIGADLRVADRQQRGRERGALGRREDRLVERRVHVAVGGEAQGEVVLVARPHERVTK